MDGDKRRRKILQFLVEAKEPVTGHMLAGEFDVSRQIIVQDIALLRVQNKNILSTNKGYFMYHNEDTANKHERVFRVKHTSDQILDEFFTIVDLGGHVLDLFVEHEIYGQIQVDLIINNRVDAKDFYEKLKNSSAAPLSLLTDGYHYHTVEADTEQLLEYIENALKEKGFME